MILKVCIAICAVFVFTFIVRFLYQLYHEYSRFNKGICPKCGYSLVKVDIGLQGKKSYCCPNCLRGAIVKFHWIDKNYKNKI